MKRQMDYEFYNEILTRNLRQKLIKERRDELDKLQARIKYIEMELEGMGVALIEGKNDR